MVEVNLSTCLINNARILGPDCIHLGKTQGNGFLGVGRYKILLSYDSPSGSSSESSSGWSLIRLNILQIFLRTYFGFYKSTHLKTLMKPWKQLIRDGKGDELYRIKRIRHIWERRYFALLGTSRLSQANIYLFPENHTDIVYRKAIAQFINDQYREGDVVLIEGLKTGKTLQANGSEQTNYLKKEITLQGWEPDNLEELFPESFVMHQKMISKVYALYNDIRKKIPEDTNPTDSDLEPLEASLPDFIDEYQRLAAYFKLKTTLSHNTLSNWFQKLKDKQLAKECHVPQAANGRVFKMLLYREIEALQKNFDTVRYTYTTQADVEKAKSSLCLRNGSMCRQIELYRNIGKKIFVIAGLRHILRTPQLPNPEYTAELHAALQKHAFTILAKRSRFERERLAAYNPNLPPQSL